MMTPQELERERREAALAETAKRTGATVDEVRRVIDYAEKTEMSARSGLNRHQRRAWQARQRREAK